MRKFILISALLLASASAQAGPTAGPVLAAADEAPAATAPNTPAQPAPPAGQTDAPPPPVAQTDAPKPQVSEAAKPAASKPRVHVRRPESDEAKARRIAARYGIYW